MKLSCVLPMLHAAGSIALVLDSEEDRAVWPRDFEDAALLDARQIPFDDGGSRSPQRRAVPILSMAEVLYRRDVDAGPDESLLNSLFIGRRSSGELQRRGGCLGKMCGRGRASSTSATPASPRAQSDRDLYQVTGRSYGMSRTTGTQTLEQAGLGGQHSPRQGGNTQY